jgi:hypothetical protein
MQTPRGYFRMQEIQGSRILRDEFCFVLGYLCILVMATNNFLHIGCELACDYPHSYH